MSELEFRAAPIEIRAVGAVGKAERRRLEGYAAVFNKRASIGRFEEEIAPGAFSRSLASGTDILALSDHDPAKVLGRTKSGFLRLVEDSKGLEFRLDLPSTSIAADVLSLVESGNSGGASVGFVVRQGGESWAGNVRTLTDLDLREISIISSNAAYPDTDVTARMKGWHRDGAAVRLQSLKRFLESC